MDSVLEELNGGTLRHYIRSRRKRTLLTLDFYCLFFLLSLMSGSVQVGRTGSSSLYHNHIQAQFIHKICDDKKDHT